MAKSSPATGIWVISILVTCTVVFMELNPNDFLAQVPGQNDAPRLGRGRRQLFLDNYLIGEMKGLKRLLHQPQKYARNPVVVGDRPWERSFDTYGVDMPSALYEPELGKIRLWYRAVHSKATVDYEELSLDPEERKRQNRRSVDATVCQVAYAESKDGVKFEKPKLGLIEFQGKKDNNLVWGPMGDWANMVLKFPAEPDPAKRYKCIIWPIQHSEGYYGNIGLYSPDGQRWTMAPLPSTRKLQLHHAYNFGYDPLRKQYLALIQYQTKPRTVSRKVSTDFVNWHDEREVLIPDSLDPRGTEFYVPTITMLDDLYLCFLHVFHTDPKEEDFVAGVRAYGTIDVQLATSRDGLRWERAMEERKTFLPLGPKGAFDDSMVFYVGPPVEFQDKLFFYYGGWNGDHGAVKRSCVIGLATLRVDGYASIEPQDEQGELITKPFTLEGTNLDVNGDASRGAIRVAVLDRDGKPVGGFGLEEAEPISTDGLTLRVKWKQRQDASSLKGKVIRLKFHLRNAKLFAFQIKA